MGRHASPILTCLILAALAIGLALTARAWAQGPVRERRALIRTWEIPRDLARVLLTLPEAERERDLAFFGKDALNPILLDGDPYIVDGERVIHPPESPWGPEAACAILYEDADRIRYRLQTFASREEAEGAGAHVTHMGTCGTCSTLQDLSVYLAFDDLTTPVRRCASRAYWEGGAKRCLRAMGFTDACAETWYYNARNTAQRCMKVCLGSWLRGESFNTDGGALNPCLRCDEDLSGPIFLQAAGRQRRNSGIRSEIGRPDAQVVDLVHDYQ